MTLHVHHNSRVEDLLGALIDDIDSDVVVDPFVPEVIPVPLPEIERYIVGTEPAQSLTMVGCIPNGLKMAHRASGVWR